MTTTNYRGYKIRTWENVTFHCLWIATIEGNQKHISLGADTQTDVILKAEAWIDRREDGGE